MNRVKQYLSLMTCVLLVFALTPAAALAVNKDERSFPSYL